MNKYKIELRATDSAGIKFLENVVRFANLGATIDSDYPTKNTFPNKVMLNVETEKFLEDDMVNGVRVYPVELQYSKEQLDAMSWPEFKETVKALVPKGRDRTIMTNKYLEACKTGIVSDSEE